MSFFLPQLFRKMTVVYPVLVLFERDRYRVRVCGHISARVVQRIDKRLGLHRDITYSSLADSG